MTTAFAQLKTNVKMRGFRRFSLVQHSSVNPLDVSAQSHHPEQAMVED
jgi:hypothetical protein